MFEIKNTNIKENFETVSAAVGLMAMTAAVMASTFELGHKPDTRVVLPNQPALATVDNQNGDNNPIRREREETAPHHISYNETQRTPSRSGKQ